MAAFKKDELARDTEEEKKLKLLRKEKKQRVIKAAEVKSIAAREAADNAVTTASILIVTHGPSRVN